MNYQQQEQQQYYNYYNTAPNIPIDRYEIEKKSNNNLYIGLLVFCFFAMLYYLSVSLPKKKAEEKAEADAAVAAEKKKKEEAEAAAKKDTPDTQGSAIIPPAVPPRRFPAPPKGAVEFGGMFGYGHKKIYKNPVTMDSSCPDEFTEYEFMDTSGVDYSAKYCYKTIDDPDTWTPSEGSVEFGGMYTGNGAYKNPLSGGSRCPTGFTSSQVLETFGIDHGLHFCYREIEDPDTWVPDEYSLALGGFFSENYNTHAGKSMCPTKFKTIQAYGATDWNDKTMKYCAVKYDDL